MPDRSVDEHIETAWAFVRHLLSRGFVKLYYDFPTQTRRRVVELTESQAEREMADRANWLYRERRKPDEPCVTIGATPAGERAVYNCRYPAD